MTLTAYACTWPTPGGPNEYRLHLNEQAALATAKTAPTPNVVYELDVDLTVAEWVRLQFEWAFPWLRIPDNTTPENPS